MPRVFLHIFIYISSFLFCISCTTEKNSVYHGGSAPLRSHNHNTAAKSKMYSALNKQKRGFSSSPTGSNYSNAYAKTMEKERRGFGRRGNVTHGSPNALANNRHTSSFFKRTFPFLFPANPNYSRGRRSRLGLYHLK